MFILIQNIKIRIKANILKETAVSKKFNIDYEFQENVNEVLKIRVRKIEFAVASKIGTQKAQIISLAVFVCISAKYLNDNKPLIWFFF